MSAPESLSMTAPRRRPLSLAVCRDFDTRWVGELPIVFDGTPAECITFAEARGCLWVSKPEMLFGGYFSHPDECLDYMPV